MRTMPKFSRLLEVSEAEQIGLSVTKQEYRFSPDVAHFKLER